MDEQPICSQNCHSIQSFKFSNVIFSASDVGRENTHIKRHKRGVTAHNIGVVRYKRG